MRCVYNYYLLLPDILTLSDLKTILEELCRVAYKWKSIGIQLSLEDGVLKNIQSSCQTADIQATLHEIVSEWLKRVHPPPTWKALVEALRSKSVGEKRLALSIEQKYCMPTAGKLLTVVALHTVPVLPFSFHLPHNILTQISAPQ